MTDTSIVVSGSEVERGGDRQPVQVTSTFKSPASSNRGENNEETPRMAEASSLSFSFAGCGFLGVYHVGVVDCLKQFIPHILAKAEFAGASAGALIAACIVCDVPLDGTVRTFLDVAKEACSYPLGAFDTRMKVGEILKRALEEMLPANAHVLCSGRLYISVSKMKHIDFRQHTTMFENEIISQFENRDKLIETLLCSSYIPVFSSTEISIMDREITMDGFFTDNLPRVDSETILVCPLAGDNDICPQDPPVPNRSSITVSNSNIEISLENARRMIRCFFPGSPEEFMEFYHAGFEDALSFLIQKKFFRCAAHEGLCRRLLNDEDDIINHCLRCNMAITRASRQKIYSLDPVFQTMAADLKNVTRFCAGIGQVMRSMWKYQSEAVKFLHLILKIYKGNRLGKEDSARVFVDNADDLLVEDEGELTRQILMRGQVLVLMNNMAALLEAVNCVVALGQKLGIGAMYQKIQLHRGEADRLGAQRREVM